MHKSCLFFNCRNIINHNHATCAATNSALIAASHLPDSTRPDEDYMHDLVKLHRFAKEISHLDLSKETADTCLKNLLRFSHGFMTFRTLPNQNDIWFRARICEQVDKYDQLSDVLVNKHGRPKLGRCNLPDQRVFYAASNRTTAVKEVCAKKDDLVQVTGVRPIGRKPFLNMVLGAYREVDQSGDMPRVLNLADLIKWHKATNKRTYKQALFIDTMLSELFSNPSEDKYLLTAALSDHHLKEVARTAVNGGIVYPSVKHNLGFNLVTTSSGFDEHFEVIVSEVFRIDDVLPNGSFIRTSMFSADDFSVDGTILWEKPLTRIFQQGIHQHEYPRTPGWRPQPS